MHKPRKLRTRKASPVAASAVCQTGNVAELVGLPRLRGAISSGLAGNAAESAAVKTIRWRRLLAV